MYIEQSKSTTLAEPEKPEQVYKELREMCETMVARLENASKGVAKAC